MLENVRLPNRESKHDGKDSTLYRNITNKKDRSLFKLPEWVASKKLIFSYHNLLTTPSSTLILQVNEKTKLIEHFFDIDLTHARDTIEEMVS